VTELDSIDNQRLIANGLQHMAYELSLPDPSYFRIAREAHLALYRSMIEALKGTANLTITGRLSKNGIFRYQAGRSPWREIRRQQPPPGKKAWRFTAPVEIPEPTPTGERAEEPADWLVDFYDALAMVDSTRFRRQPRYAATVLAACCRSKSNGLT
jgi:hypothetical protein